MHAFGQHLYLEHATGHAAQTGGQPQLVIVARATVQANHQGHLAQARAQGIDVRQQVAGARFLAGFDQPHHAGVGNVLRFERCNGRDAGVDRIAIVGAAAAIQLVAHDLGRPRPQVGTPAVKLGLLVHVAIQQNGFSAGGAGSGHLKHQHRCAPRQAHHLQGQTRDFLRFDPRGRVQQHLVQPTVRRPLRVKCRGLGGHGDVVLQLRHDAGVPAVGHMRQGLVWLQIFGQQGGVHGEDLLKIGHGWALRPWRFIVPGPSLWRARRCGRPQAEPPPITER